jgi:ABC-type Fe3+/spermidine/putrescine transport system ATPase subunit
MNEGRVEQIGAPSEIYHRPRSRFVADFIGESNFLDVELAGSANGVVRLRDGTPVPGRRGDVDPGAGRAALMVRPESIRISTEPDRLCGPGLKGRVLQTSFLGNHTRVAVACDAVDAPVLASLFGRDQVGQRDLRLDMEVTLWWEPDDAVLLPETHSEPEEEGQT